MTLSLLLMNECLTENRHLFDRAAESYFPFARAQQFFFASPFAPLRRKKKSSWQRLKPFECASYS